MTTEHTESNEPRLHNLKTVSERTALSRSALYRLIAAGDLRAVKIGKAIRVSEAAIIEFIERAERGEFENWNSGDDEE